MSHVQNMGFKGQIAIHADNREAASALSESGAHYVTVPTEESVQEAVKLIKKLGLEKAHYQIARRAYIEKLRSNLPALGFVPTLTFSESCLCSEVTGSVKTGLLAELLSLARII